MKLFENLNHHFNVDPIGATDGYDRLPTQALAPEFLQTIAGWLAHTLATDPAWEGQNDGGRR